LFLAATGVTFAINDVGDPNYSVVDVMQANRLIDVNPGDQFWLTVTVASKITAMQVDMDGVKGRTWLKAGEFLPVQYNEPGEYTIRLRTAQGRVLPPFTVRVIGLSAEAEQPRGHNGAKAADGVQVMAAAASGPSFSVGSVYAGDYVVGPNTVGKYPVRIVAKGIGDCRLTKYGDTNTTWVWHFDLADFGTNALAEKSDVLDGPQTGSNAWTLVKSSGGTHVLSPNSPSKLKVLDLLLVDGPPYTPVGESVKEQTVVVVSNDVLTLQVVLGPNWVTNNPVAAGPLIEWFVYNHPEFEGLVAAQAMNGDPAVTGLRVPISPPPGSNTVVASSHSLDATNRQQLTVLTPTIKIKWGDTDVTGASTNVIVGQQVALTGSLSPSGVAVTQWNWNIPGYAISNFVVSADTNSSQVIELTATNAANANWYWVSGGAKQVVATATLTNGAVVTGKVDFAVLRPNIAVTTITSTVVIEDNQTLKFGAGGNEGVVFRRNVGELYGGSTFWAQIITNSSTAIRLTNGCAQSSIVNQLDSRYPYAETTGCPDSPEQSLMDNFTDVTRQDQSRMFLMYKPPGTDVVHVPLSLVEWQWSGHAVRSNGVWQLQSSSHSENPGGVDPVGATSAVFPVWFGIAMGGTNDLIVGPCP
jgi:hypothetical protein